MQPAFNTQVFLLRSVLSDYLRIVANEYYVVYLTILRSFAGKLISNKSCTVSL